MYRHLVSIEVGVEGRTHQWVKSDSLSFDKLRLEGLNTQSVKGRGTVEQYRMSLDHILQDIPYHRFFFVNNTLGRFDCFHNTALDELTDYERLIEFGSHILRQAAFV